MAASSERHQALEAFIREAFPLDKAASKALAPGADADQTAASADVIAFLQSREVLDITESYLTELRALWLCSEYGQPAWPEKKETAPVSADLPEPDPSPEPKSESLATPALPAAIDISEVHGDALSESLATPTLPAAWTLSVTLPEFDPESLAPQAFPIESQAFAEHASPAGSLAPESPLAAAAPMPPLADEAVAHVSPAAASPQPLPAPVPLVAAPARPQGSAPVHHGLRPGQMPSATTPWSQPAEPRIRFQLPNAKAGQPYAGKLEGRDASGKAVLILDATADPATGLSFDVPSSELRGTPARDGDYPIVIHWTFDGVAEHISECLLFVNPDPRSLWKHIAPPADDPYFKPNTDAALIAGPHFSIAAASRRGRSHAHVGSFRDDDFFIHHDAPSGWSVLMVADGAGSARHSRWGSKLAVTAAGAHVASELSGAFGQGMTEALAGWSGDMAAASKAMHTPFYRLFQEASRLAVEAIEQEASSKNALPKDYATTLLAAAVRREADHTFVAAFWMGDGAIAAYGPRGKVRLMGTPDSGEFAGQTRFLDHAALTDSGFGKRLVLGRYADLSAVIVMTDGISDPRFETDNGLADAAKWDALWDDIGPLLAAPEPHKAMLEWLDFLTPGHHDDRTIAVLW